MPQMQPNLQFLCQSARDRRVGQSHGLGQFGLAIARIGDHSSAIPSVGGTVTIPYLFTNIWGDHDDHPRSDRCFFPAIAPS